ncbi:MAG: trk system potassium uptake protein TrkH [Halieaceae bacterium]|jgi:trk system potassium uptake protein TrkH
MHISITFRILGVLLMLFSITLTAPLIISLVQDDGAALGFSTALVITFLAGSVLWLPVRNSKHELRIRDGFLITSMFWTVLGLFGALPFALSNSPHLSISDSIFESISGLTTTGATVISGLDALPKSILFYRAQLQWLGGIGIIVIAVAILPMLGIGGMQLYRAETPGPSKNNKLTPRITETAKALFLVYLSLTAACALSYYLAGMTAFDAICHSFSTVAIGGFSTHDASIGYFKNDSIVILATFFMFISAINFGLHFTAWRSRSAGVYFNDSEIKFFSGVLLIGVVLCCAVLIYSGEYDWYNGIVHGLFQAVSITTTTGYATAEFSLWPSFLPLLLIMLSFMGGCVGSTGGGIKAMRLMLIYKQGLRELKQLVHPAAVIPLKIGSRRVESQVVSAVWSFFAVYMAALIIIWLLLMGTGMDIVTAFSSVAAALNNLGPGLGNVAANYGSITDSAKWILCFAMLLGRLEIFTLLVLFTPMFWRS